MSENTENAQPDADASRVPLDCIVGSLISIGDDDYNAEIYIHKFHGLVMRTTRDGYSHEKKIDERMLRLMKEIIEKYFANAEGRDEAKRSSST